MNTAASSNGIRVVIVGPPGCGKGTICKQLVKDFGFLHLSSGDMLRSQISKQTEVGVLANTYISVGQLVPDHCIIKLVMNELEDHSGRILLDGFPRTEEQCLALETNFFVDFAINLDVPEREIIERISERWTHLPSGRVYSKVFNPPLVDGKDDDTGEELYRRTDDEPESVQERLKWYELQTKPVLSHYARRSNLYTFDGTTYPELVLKDRRSDAIYREVYDLLNK